MKSIDGIILIARRDGEGRYELTIRNIRNIDTYMCTIGDFHNGYNPYRRMYVMSANLHPRIQNWERDIVVRIEIYSPPCIGIYHPNNLLGKKVHITSYRY